MAARAAHQAAHYGVNPLVFVVLYFATWPPYLLSVGMVAVSLRKGSRRKAALWVVVFLVSFALPYAYVLVAGSGIPPMIRLAAAAVLAVSCWVAVRKRVAS